MKKSLSSLAIAAAMALMASSASAALFTIDNGIDASSALFTGNGSSSTSAIEELGYTGTLTTSIYLGNPAVVGTQVIDTNIASVMTTYGFTAGSHTALAGNSITTSFPTTVGSFNIDSLNNTTQTVDTNGFAAGSAAPVYGQLGAWGLTYEYEITGHTTATGVYYDGGYFNIFYQDGSVTPVQVAKLIVNGSSLTIANLEITGYLDFSFTGGSSAFVQNFWNRVGGLSFYDQWLANPTSVTFALDTNVNPPLPTLNQLYQTAQGTLIRQSTLDGSLTFTVPEPGSVALLGLGLAGLGLTQRRRKMAAAK